MKRVMYPGIVRSLRWGIVLLSMSTLLACSSSEDNSPTDNNGQNKVSNNLPEVYAGQDYTAAEYLSELTLNGGFSDVEDGQQVSALWTQVGGPSTTTIADPKAASTQVQIGVFTESSATFTFRLTATDSDGGSNSDDVVITIPKPLLSINAGSDIAVNNGDEVALHAEVSYPDPDLPKSIVWEKVSSTVVTGMSGINTADLSFTAPQVSVVTSLQFDVTVSMTIGGETETAIDTVTVTVYPPGTAVNIPPTVEVQQQVNVKSGNTVTITGSGSDSDGTVAGYLWEQFQNGAPAVQLTNSDTPTVSFDAPTVNSVTVITLVFTVMDDQGATASAQVTVTVNPNAPPVANAGGDVRAVSGNMVQITGSGSDADGSIDSYAWSQFNGPSVTLSGADSSTVQFTAPTVTTEDSITLRLTVADNDGAQASDDVLVTILPANGNQPPVAQAGDDQAVNPGDTVTLTGAGEDSDGIVAGYLWEHTPGSAQEPVIDIAAPQQQTIEFTAPDVSESTALTFTLTVTDDAGDTGTDTVVVTVHPLAMLSGTITAASATLTDSDTNAEGTTPVANNPYTNFQHIPNPATVGGYVHQEGVGPAGSSNTNGGSDAEDVYHAIMTAGQVVSLYLGESYFDPSTDPSNPAQPVIYVWLTNDYATPADSVLYAWGQASNGVLSLTVPNRNDLPADGHYLISIQAGPASAYSYVLTVGSAAPAQTNGWSTELDFVPNELIVEFKDPVPGSQQNLKPLAQRAASVGMQALGGAPGRSMLLGLGQDAVAKSRAFAALGIQAQAAPAAADAVLQAKIDTIRAAAALKQRTDVQSVRLNRILYPNAVPNDTLYARQWHYPLINLPQAWDTTTGSADVTVAVIDTGILPNHPDIDNNRLVDGYDFIRSASNAGDGNGIDPNPQDPGDGGGVRASSFHGTHVAGTIAANTNNGIGVAGIAWQVNIMPLRVLGINGGTEYDIEQAIRYAAQLSNDSGTLPSRKADVINLSLGGPANTTQAPQAYRDARAAGVIIVAAAGNDGSNQPSAPAAYNGVVSVSAVTVNKQRASYSNYGSTIDVAAPGGNYSDTNGDGLPDAVWSTRGNDSSGTIQYTYDYAAGTSMASPHVAGVVALMKSVYPDLTPAEFDTMLSSGDLTEDLGTSGRDNNFGYGLIDAQKAVAAAVAASGGSVIPPDPAVLAVTPTALNFGSQLTVIEISISNSGGGTLTINNITDDAGGWLSITPITVDAQGLGLYAVTANRDGLAQGLFSATINVASENNGSLDIPVSMQVFPTQVINDAGPQVVELIDINSQQVVQSLRLLPTDGVYNFNFDGVRLGVYHVRSSSDLDNDGTLCELGESCGAYPTLNTTVSSEIPVDGTNLDINGLDFETGFHVNVVAQ
jgi:serine protease